MKFLRRIVPGGPAAGSRSGTLGRRRMPVGRLVPAALVALASGAEAQPTYVLDEDPIRIGRKAFEEGRLEDARRAFEEALAASYQIPRANFGLGLIAVRQGRYEDGLSRLRDAVDTGEAATRQTYPEARAELGLLLLRVGRTSEADAQFQVALEGDPKLWSALYGKARVLLEQGKAEDAKALLDRGAKRKGLKEGEDRYHFGLALHRMQTGDLDAAEQEALHALALDSGEPEYAILVGEIHEKRGTPALAIQAFETALAAPGARPGPAMLHRLGRLYEDDGRYSEARDLYLRAVEADSTFAPALGDLADLLRRGNYADTAARIYLRYLALVPGDLKAWLGFGASCLETRRYEDCVRAAESALALDSTRVEARWLVTRCGIRSRDPGIREEASRAGEALLDSTGWTSEDLVLLAAYATEQGRPAAAAAFLDRGRALDPENPALPFQAGLLFLKQGDAPAAIPEFQRAIELEPESGVYHMDLAVALLQAGRTLEAIESLRRALALEPDLAVGHLYLAQALAASDSLEAAEVEYRKVLASDPSHLKALRGLGYCAIQRGDYQAAAEAYGRATRAEPEDAEAWAGLGSAHLGLSDWAAAEEAFRKAKAIDPANLTAERGLELLDKARKESR